MKILLEDFTDEDKDDADDDEASFLPELIFSLKTIGVIYFWKAGDARMSEMKFAGTTGTIGT